MKEFKENTSSSVLKVTVDEVPWYKVDSSDEAINNTMYRMLLISSPEFIDWLNTNLFTLKDVTYFYNTDTINGLLSFVKSGDAKPSVLRLINKYIRQGSKTIYSDLMFEGQQQAAPNTELQFIKNNEIPSNTFARTQLHRFLSNSIIEWHVHRFILSNPNIDDINDFCITMGYPFDYIKSYSEGKYIKDGYFIRSIDNNLYILTSDVHHWSELSISEFDSQFKLKFPNL